MGGLLSAQLRSTLIGFNLIMIDNCQSNLRVNEFLLVIIK